MYKEISIFIGVISLFITGCKKENITSQEQDTQNAELFSASYLALGLDTAKISRLVLPKSESVGDSLLQRNKLWRGRTELTISFFEGTSGLREKIVAYANEWSSSTGITFQTVESAGDIRISFDKQSGSWSYIGTDALLVDRNEPTMNYAWLTEETSETEFKEIVLHEFGHALGLTHEQQLTDREINWNKQNAYIYYSSYPNFWTTEQVDAFVFNVRSNVQTIHNPNDSKSVMRYPISSILLNDIDTVKANSTLSASDKSLTSFVYPTTTSTNRLKNIGLRISK